MNSQQKSTHIDKIYKYATALFKKMRRLRRQKKKFVKTAKAIFFCEISNFLRTLILQK